jgi:hypothetical protein
MNEETKTHLGVIAPREREKKRVYERTLKYIFRK